jgi:RNA polymerase sigma-70 factor (ECF subfamily)
MVATITRNVTMNEQYLIKQLAVGNFAAYETLFKNYYELLCYHALTYTGDAAAAQDAVSDVFARIWEKRSQLQIETSVKSYLYRAVSNQCIDILRKNYHKKTVLVESFQHCEPYYDYTTTYTSPETKELAVTIELAIRQLPKQCGIIFRLSREAGLKYQEIAAQLNISVKTVETQMGRAFKALRLSILKPEMKLQVA